MPHICIIYTLSLFPPPRSSLTLPVHILTLATVWQSWPWSLNSICSFWDADVQLYGEERGHRTLYLLMMILLGGYHTCLVQLWLDILVCLLFFFLLKLFLCTFISVIRVTLKVTHDKMDLVNNGYPGEEGGGVSCYLNVCNLSCDSNGVNVFTYHYDQHDVRWLLVF